MRGKVYGLDMTNAMFDKLRQNIAARGVTNVQPIEGNTEEIPLPDASVDVVTSNGVLSIWYLINRAPSQKSRVRGGSAITRAARPIPSSAHFRPLRGATVHAGFQANGACHFAAQSQFFSAIHNESCDAASEPETVLIQFWEESRKQDFDQGARSDCHNVISLVSLSRLPYIMLCHRRQVLAHVFPDAPPVVGRWPGSRRPASSDVVQILSNPTRLAALRSIQSVWIGIGGYPNRR
jgi:hypothetical protein